MKKKEILKLDDKDLDKIIKIRGTEHDRKRKLSDKQIEKARILYAQYGATLWDLAVMFGVDVRTIRYNLQSSYRDHILEYAKSHPQLTRKHYNYADKLSDRVAYKRSLVAHGKVCV